MYEKKEEEKKDECEMKEEKEGVKSLVECNRMHLPTPLLTYGLGDGWQGGKWGCYPPNDQPSFLLS